MKDHTSLFQKVIQRKYDFYKGNISAVQRDLGVGRKMIEKVIMKRTSSKPRSIRLSDQAVQTLVQSVESQNDLFLREIQEIL